MKELDDLFDKHCRFCDQAPPGPWKSEDNKNTGLKEIWGEKNIHGDKIMEIKKFDPKAVDFMLFSRELLPRYIEALEFLKDCYDASNGSSDVGKQTLQHVEKILQGVS